jgi:sulfur carrier protein
MIITMNGAQAEVPAGTTLAGLLQRAGQDAAHRGIAVARNGEVVPRSLWNQQNVADGDVVELLTASQGG